MIIKITPQIEEMARTLCGEKEKTCAQCESFALCEFPIEASVLVDAGYRKQSDDERADRLPKKAKISIHGTTDWNTRCRCPVCDKDLFDSQKYCSECGQKIDWGKGKEQT